MNAERENQYYPERGANRRRGLADKPRSKILITEYDPIIFIVVILLLMIGMIMVLSSSYYSALKDPNVSSMYFYFFKQLTAAVIGFLVMIIIATINYHSLRIFVIPGYLLANVLLVVVRFFGTAANGATRWLTLPGGFSFQPSEFAKAMVIIMLAFYITNGKGRTKTLKGLFGCACIIGLPCLLIGTENLSSVLIIIAIGLGMLFVSSPHAKKFVIAGGAGAAGLTAYLALFSSGFRGDRFKAWLDPWSDPLNKGFQTIQSLYAVASGGLFGLGLGQSRQKLKYMPEPQNDFIFAVICEELGFFGAAVVLLLFAALIWRAVKVALSSTDLLGCLLATGIALLVGVQVVVNVAVVTNTIPNTGIPLPFISFGGTSLIFIMGLMGILLNISRYTKITA